MYSTSLSSVLYDTSHISPSFPFFSHEFPKLRERERQGQGERKKREREREGRARKGKGGEDKPSPQWVFLLSFSSYHFKVCLFDLTHTPLPFILETSSISLEEFCFVFGLNNTRLIFFSINIYIQYNFVLVSGVQLSG